MKFPKPEFFTLITFVVFGLGPLACGDGKPLVSTPEGTFSSANPNGPDGGGGSSTTGAGTNSSSTDGGGRDSEGGTGGDGDRAIEEADIVKVVGDRLYAMSRYGGVPDELRPEEILEKSSTLSVSWSANNMARSTAFRSSRTLPGP